MPTIITRAAAINPCINVHGVELLIESISTDLEFFDDGCETKAIKWFIDSLEGLYNIYYAKYGNPKTTESSSGASSSRASGGNQMSRFNKWEGVVNPKNKTHYASLEMCMCLKDHLDAQERKQAKSSLENPVDFEEEILDAEDHLDAQERKQAKSSLENPVDFEEEILDAEVQQNEAISLSDEKITLDAANSEGTMSGSGSGGEEVDYDKTNYGDDY
nr:hypothetical protein [Tanacetum cinerariifolium]